MKCPHCNADTKSPVIETRNHDGGVYRARRCDSCGTRFVTVERTHAAGMPQRVKARQLARLETWQRQNKTAKKATGVDYMAAWRTQA